MLSKRRSQGGDTIIEVMIALVLLGLAFGISYATANRALQMSQNSQEHTQALQIIASQAELARSGANNPSLHTSNSSQLFCISPSGDTTSDIKVSPIFLQAEVTKDLSGQPSNVPAACQVTLNGQAHYTVYDSYDAAKPSPTSPSQDIFTFTITWPGVGQLGNQQEQISYKLHGLSS